MRTVPIHWLLLVCFLATPLSHGQATEAVPMTAHEIAFAFANWSGTPQLIRARQARRQQQTRQAFPRITTPAPITIPEPASLPPHSSETPTAQPAGP